MQINAVARVDQSLASLCEAAGRFRADAYAAPGPDAIAGALRLADHLTATAVSLLGRGGFDSGSGLPAEMFLRLYARRAGFEARGLAQAARALGAMPATRVAFEDGRLSWGQVRAVVGAVRHGDGAAREAADALVAAARADEDPDDLLGRVDDEMARRRADLQQSRADRAFDRGFVSFQARLGGGGSIYGEADAPAIATIVEAIEAASARPTTSAADDAPCEAAPTRGSQLLDGLLAICRHSLEDEAGASRPESVERDSVGNADADARTGAARTQGEDGRTPRARRRSLPRLYLTVEAAAAGAPKSPARLLWALPGRPPRLSPVDTATLACDAEIVPMLFERGRPLAVGDAGTPIPAKTRLAVSIRDSGCRFPGCEAPLSWTDCHHIRPRAEHGSNDPTNLVMLCRRCHRRVHRSRWRITVEEGEVIRFSFRGRTFTSHSRTRPPPRE